MQRPPYVRGRDYTRFDVTIGYQTFRNQPKRLAIFYIVKHLCVGGVTPELIAEIIHRRKSHRLFMKVTGEVDSETFVEEAMAINEAFGRSAAKLRRFFDDDQLNHADGITYAFTTQWGTRTEEAMKLLVEEFPDAGVSFQVSAK